FNNNVSIRGFGSPLVIIDGVPRDGTQDLAQLNSNDVESISFLKDGSAAIYGMNSGNGVILVTTKKGVSGKPVFSYQPILSTKAATGLEQTVDAYTYRVMKNEMDKNIGASPTYAADVIEKFRTNQPGFTDNNWIDLTLHDRVFQQQHNLSVRGGTDRSRYFTSFGYAEDNGLLKSNVQKYRRYNFRATNSSNLTDNLRLNINFAGRLDNTNSPRDNFLWVLKPIMVTDRGVGPYTIGNPNHLTSPNQENTNPVAMMNPDLDGYRYQSDRQFATTVDLNYDMPFLKGMKATILGAYDVNTRNESALRKAYDLYDYNTDARILTFGNNQYSNFIENYTRIYVRGQLGYQTRIADAHNISATGVAEMTRTRVDNVNAARQFTDLYTSDLINSGTPTTATNSGFRNFGALAGYVGKLNYDYKGKYFLEGMVRYDGTFRYAPN
ncbi:MAG: SusC/RagA family TonB-linked outer membrane protein, partial [Pedobacter sp.]